MVAQGGAPLSSPAQKVRAAAAAGAARCERREALRRSMVRCWRAARRRRVVRPAGQASCWSIWLDQRRSICRQCDISACGRVYRVCTPIYATKPYGLGRSRAQPLPHARTACPNTTVYCSRQASPCAPTSSLPSALAARPPTSARAARASSRRLLHPACAARPGSRALASHSPRTVQSIARPFCLGGGPGPARVAAEGPSVRASEPRAGRGC